MNVLKWNVLALILGAAALRFAGLVVSGGWAGPLQTEPTEEVRIARALAEGRGFASPFYEPNQPRAAPSAHSPPGFPYLLAGIIRAARSFATDRLLPYRLALVLNVLVGATVVGLLAVVGGNARGRGGFWCVGLLALVWPPLVAMSGLLWDTPYALLAIATALVLVTTPAPRPPGLAMLVLIGCLFGVFTLFNPLPGPFLFVALIAVALRGVGPHSKRAVGGLLAACVAWGLCLTPWEIRNAVEFQRFIPIRHNFGLELWLGNLPDSDGTTTRALKRHPMDEPGERARLIAMGDDVYMQSKALQARALIRAAPGRFLELTGKRILLYWFGEVRRPTVVLGRALPMWSGVNVLEIAGNGLLLAAAVAGGLTWRSGPARRVCWTGLLTFPLPYYVTHVTTNYRVFVAPLLCTLAGVLLARLIHGITWERAANRRLPSDGSGPSTAP